VAVAVYFYDQPEFGTVEIHDVVVYGFLTKKFVLSELPHAENFVPDFAFGLGRIFAVFTGAFGQVFVVGEEGRVKDRRLFRSQRQTPPPPPLIRGGAFRTSPLIRGD
jgi:hypothetical protein